MDPAVQEEQEGPSMAVWRRIWETDTELYSLNANYGPGSNNLVPRRVRSGSTMDPAVQEEQEDPSMAVWLRIWETNTELDSLNANYGPGSNNGGGPESLKGSRGSAGGGGGEQNNNNNSSSLQQPSPGGVEGNGKGSSSNASTGTGAPNAGSATLPSTGGNAPGTTGGGGGNGINLSTTTGANRGSNSGKGSSSNNTNNSSVPSCSWSQRRAAYPPA